MRVDVTPTAATALPGQPVVLTVAVTNTTEVISGHAVRVLGVDPRWVDLSHERLSLFPGATGICTVTLNLPPGLLSGQRRVCVQVRELTDGGAAEVVDVDLDLPPVLAVDTRLEPASLTTGRRGSFGLLVRNTGNTPYAGELVGSDEEGKVGFHFSPNTVELAPGEHAVVEVGVRGRRRLVGSLAVRPVVVRAAHPDDPADDSFAATNGTLLQRPVLGRGALSLMGLLAAVTVFALVITFALSGVVGRSAADRDLALQVAQVKDSTAIAGSSSLAGTARLLTSGSPVPGVTVELFDAADTGAALTSIATSADGTYALSGIAAGTYKLRYRGAGFAELWYPGALTDADATAITVEAGQTQGQLDVSLGGLPASLAGVVDGGDPTGATVTLLLPGTATPDGGGGSVSSVVTGSATGSAVDSGAVVRTVKVGADGAFVLTQVPSPSVYDLAVAKPGFATQVERIDLGGGEERTGLKVRLLKGDGLISGTVADRSGVLAGATVSAQYGTTTVQTTSLTGTGEFILRGLPTPGSFTVVVSAPDRASQTLSLSLTAGQRLTGVAVTLGGASGSLGGTVTLADEPAGTPATGVTVVVTNGTTTLQTVTSSRDDPGSWLVTGLPLLSTYTVTFSRADLAPQTLAVALDAFGAVTGGGPAADAVHAALRSSTLRLTGQTRLQPATGDSVAASEVVVTVTSGSSSYTVVSASVPAASRGRFVLDRLVPGTYTVTATARGTRPSSKIVTLVPDEPVDDVVLVLPAPAGITGVVRTETGTTLTGAQVRLYLSAAYPETVLATTTTDANGAYAFAGVEAPQTYVLEHAYPPGSTPRSSRTLVLRESQQAVVDLGGAP